MCDLAKGGIIIDSYQLEMKLLLWNLRLVNRLGLRYSAIGDSKGVILKLFLGKRVRVGWNLLELISE